MAPRRAAAPPPGPPTVGRPAKSREPFWACNCGFITNWAFHKTCNRCCGSKGFGKPLSTQPVGPSQRSPTQVAARAAKAAAAPVASPAPPVEPKAVSPADIALKAARSLVLSWERMLRDQPDLPLAVQGLADANAAVKAAKSTIESGRTHTERLQSAVTRHTQAAKEFARADSEHVALLVKVDDSAARLTAAVATLSEAEETLKSLQVEGAGAQPAAPIPFHLQADTFFAAWSEVANRLGFNMGDPATFSAMAALVFAQKDAMAAGAATSPGAVPGPVGGGAPPPASCPRAAAAAAPAPAPFTASARPFGPWASFCREEQGSGYAQAGRSRSVGPCRWRRPMGLDSHFSTAGVATPSGGAWAAPPPPGSASPVDVSGFSTPHSQKSRSRSPGLHHASVGPGAAVPVPSPA